MKRGYPTQRVSLMTEPNHLDDLNHEIKNGIQVMKGMLTRLENRLVRMREAVDKYEARLENDSSKEH